ncbi:MAG: bacteriophage abortive infection AbiH family protein [Spirochaetaceae bacterium]|nr:bacteriophage abortive infection AbiH family protein [Spirochaetaceae bacterium]
MNRIILIGNGFDLAHGLGTKYTNFIDDFWMTKLNTFIDSLKNNSLTRVPDYDTPNYDTFIYTDNDISIYVKDYQHIFQSAEIVEAETGFQTFCNFISHFRPNAHQRNCKFNNLFLGQISGKYQLEKWVDIEEEYYSALLNCLENKKNITKLNKDFKRIQILLQIYLSKQIEKKISLNKNIEKNMYLPLLQADFIEDINENKLDKVFFLNFNYTSTIKLYSDCRKDVKTINIHGQINNPSNPIVFGYGDEMDDNYKRIEKENNDFLQHVKSFMYSRTNNYKELLAFINSDVYQVYTMGLSCSTSDRTLLSTLFEHEHCKSIKIFYYNRTSSENDYLDIYMNISRSFKNKEKMRKLVVSFENSIPLTD